MSMMVTALMFVLHCSTTVPEGDQDGCEAQAALQQSLAVRRAGFYVNKAAVNKAADSPVSPNAQGGVSVSWVLFLRWSLVLR